MGNLTRYKHVDEQGVYTGSESVHNTKPGGYDFEVEHPETKRPMRKPANGYRFPPDTFAEMQKQGLILYGEDENRIVKIKKYLSDFEDTLRSVIVMDGRLGSYDCKRVFGGEEKLFNNPKPVDLILQLLSYVTEPDSIILDMFAGSCTTGEAVVRLNLLDNGRRQFLCCQLPEACPEDSVACRAGFKSIAEIGRRRLLNVIEGIRKEAGEINDAVVGFGFRSFVLAPSNFKQWRGDGIEDPDALAAQLKMFAQGEKQGSTPDDMLFELLLKMGQPLDTAVERIEVCGASVCTINKRAMVFVLENLTFDAIAPLLALKPREIVAVDAVFQANDELKTNMDLQCRDAEVRFTCV